MEPYLELCLRDGARIVHRHRGQNIWLDTGKEWLRDLVSHADAPTEHRRIRYMGFGIGGSRQDTSMVSIPPLSTDYPGTNLQTDVYPGVSSMERPVRVQPGVFLVQLSPPVFDVPHAVRFTQVLTSTDLSFAPYLAVPISEVGLFLEGSNPATGAGALVAYDTFPSIQKTATFTLEVNWVVSF